MKSRRRGLGRSLDALLGEGAKSSPSSSTVILVPVQKISPNPNQPRRDFAADRLKTLADSIRQKGVLQPVLVRCLDENRYELIAGERRWRAAQLAKLTEIPAQLHAAGDQDSAELALIENLQREDLNVMEQARAVHVLIGEYALTHKRIGESLGKSRSAVSNLVRLLELPDPVQQMLREGRLEMGQARALLGLPPARRAPVARMVEARQLSVRETEQLVRKMNRKAPPRAGLSSTDPDVEQLERRLGDQIGARVAIQQGVSGSGRMVIHYRNLDQLEDILRRLDKSVKTRRKPRSRAD